MWVCLCGTHIPSPILGAMSAVIGIVVIVAVIGLAAWAGRPKKAKGRRGTGYGDRINGDNVESATRYGPGYHGP